MLFNIARHKKVLSFYDQEIWDIIIKYDYNLSEVMDILSLIINDISFFSQNTDLLYRINQKFTAYRKCFYPHNIDGFDSFLTIFMDFYFILDFALPVANKSLTDLINGSQSLNLKKGINFIIFCKKLSKTYEPDNFYKRGNNISSSICVSSFPIFDILCAFFYLSERELRTLKNNNYSNAEVLNINLVKYLNFYPIQKIEKKALITCGFIAELVNQYKLFFPIELFNIIYNYQSEPFTLEDITNFKTSITKRHLFIARSYISIFGLELINNMNYGMHTHIFDIIKDTQILTYDNDYFYHIEESNIRKDYFIDLENKHLKPNTKKTSITKQLLTIITLNIEKLKGSIVKF